MGPRNGHLAYKDSPYGGCAYYPMLVTVMALINKAGPITPLLYGRRMEEVLRKKLAVLLATVMMLGVMSVPSSYG